ncbi:ubiquitin-conjugating enzyme E2 J1 [Chaetoceros tenuissimus]|uniref:Ubiquitin-conjugating enzyme E2 J1 n=1 Tax=Chaetoceros tenuissimus TaxID=426638 RepID=A0AAD3CTJ8_9STRA|nr:ubiquitin-conjugating enzyme E2 J1 [Chaetoceros tenuissimus]
MSKSPSLRRIQADIRELSIDPSPMYTAHPLENDMFEWHFTIRGADETDFEGGYYHGRILLPAEYPFKPPNIVFLTPSGRFETNTKVCLSFSAFHPELWQPAWGIRLILEALVSFLPTPGDGAIGALDWTSAERKRLAKKSVDYVCPTCGKCSDILKKIEQKIARKGGIDGDKKTSRFQKQIAELHALQMANHKEDEDKSKDEDEQASDDAKVIDESSPQTDETKESHEDAAVDSNTETSDVHVAEQDDKKGEDNIQSGSDENEASNATVTDTETRTEQKPAENTEPFVEEVKVINESDNCEESGEMDAQSLVQNVEKEEGNTSDPLQEVEMDEALLQDENSLNTPLLSDPVIHSGIVIFSIIVWLLIRKLSAVVDDLKALEAEIQSLK